MHVFSFDRGVIVALCFLLWIGAAGLVCWALVPKQLPDEPMMGGNPSAVVRVQEGGIGGLVGKVTLAQR